jgi:hypothetical protein
MILAANLASVACEEWMQDWPIEAANPDRLMDFIELLEAHRSNSELTYWFLDLVLESARGRRDLNGIAAVLLDAVVSAVATTRSHHLIERLEYWACADQPLDDAFEVSPIVRQALLRLNEEGPQPTKGP